jgi:MFS family permease
MGLFRSRAFSAGNAVSFLLFASNLSVTFLLAQFQQDALGQEPLEAGLRLLPLTAAFFAGAPVAGALLARVGERPLVVGGLLLQATGIAWIALIAEIDLSYAATIAPMILTGAGIAMAMPASQKSVVEAVVPSEIGKASGTFTTMRWLGGVFGIAIVIAVFAATGGYATAQDFNDGFAPAMGVAAGLSLAGAVAGLVLPARQQSTDVAASQPVPAVEGDPADAR